ncbi:MAG: transposase, partial [Hyphomicrobiaceae bacterium]
MRRRRSFTGLSGRLAACFTDLRLGAAVRHSVADLLRQRIFGIALGHEDLIDHDALRDDPALAAVLDKPGGRLAGKSTLNRMEHAGKIGRDRHHKLDHDASAIERLFVDLFLDAHREPPSRIVLDLDPEVDPVSWSPQHLGSRRPRWAGRAMLTRRSPA